MAFLRVQSTGELIEMQNIRSNANNAAGMEDVQPIS